MSNAHTTTDSILAARGGHTPGPWKIWTSCSFRRISSEATGYDGDVLHAVVQRGDGHPDLYFPNGGDQGPDARLITAAPDLLEACAAMVYKYGGIEVGDTRALECAKAAILKATGANHG